MNFTPTSDVARQQDRAILGEANANSWSEQLAKDFLNEIPFFNSPSKAALSLSVKKLQELDAQMQEFIDGILRCCLVSDLGPTSVIDVDAQVTANRTRIYQPNQLKNYEFDDGRSFVLLGRELVEATKAVMHSLCSAIDDLEGRGVIGRLTWRNCQLLDFTYGMIVLEEDRISHTEKQAKRIKKTRISGDSIETVLETTVDVNERIQVRQYLEKHFRRIVNPKVHRGDFECIAMPKRIKTFIPRIPKLLRTSVTIVTGNEFDCRKTKQLLSENQHDRTRQVVVEEVLSREGIDPAVVLNETLVIAGWHPSEVHGD